MLRLQNHGPDGVPAPENVSLWPVLFGNKAVEQARAFGFFGVGHQFDLNARRTGKPFAQGTGVFVIDTGVNDHLLVG